MPMTEIYILFGEMASGKTYAGRSLARRLKYAFYDGDDALPLTLRRKVERGWPLSIKEVDYFVKYCLVPKVRAEVKIRGNLVVAQALYSQAHRDLLEAELSHLGNVRFVFVESPMHTCLQRLWNRKSGFMWVVTSLMSKLWFDRPAHWEYGYLVSDNSLADQIDGMYNNTTTPLTVSTSD